MKKIRHLEESVRCHEELMELLKEKLVEGPTNGESHGEEQKFCKFYVITPCNKTQLTWVFYTANPNYAFFELLT